MLEKCVIVYSFEKCLRNNREMLEKLSITVAIAFETTGRHIKIIF
jgi:hypothetical protein